MEIQTPLATGAGASPTVAGDEFLGLDDSAAVLAAFREEVHVQDAAAVAQLRLAIRFASFNSPDSIADAADIPGIPGFDAPVPIAGEGAPLISEFAVVEFAAATRRSQDAARHYLGEAIELAYRLPKTWAGVLAGRVPAWRARRIAARTISLPADGAAWVDGQVAPVAGKIGYTELERVLGEAVTRYDPEAAAERLYRELESRHVRVEIGDTAVDGATATATVDGVLDLADGLDLDATLADMAAQLKALGSTDPLDIRRAQALGHLARGEWLLTTDSTDSTAGSDDEGDTEADSEGGEGDGEGGDDSDTTESADEADANQTRQAEADARTGPDDSTDADVECGCGDRECAHIGRAAFETRTGTRATQAREVSRRVRELVLHLRLTDAALYGCGDGIATLMSHTGRPLAQTIIEQLQHWCAGADTKITVKPVLDVDEKLVCHGYQPSDRLRDQVTLFHPRCAFPWCTRASATADLDHLEPWRTHNSSGGGTDSENLAPLCRVHHRVKTHGGWTYTRLTVGEYLWTSPHGYRFHVTVQGTTDITDPADGDGEPRRQRPRP